MKSFKRLLAFVGIFVLISLFYLPNFIVENFGQMNIDELIFVLLGNQEGANFKIVWVFFFNVFKYMILLTGTYFVFNYTIKNISILNRSKKKYDKKGFRFGFVTKVGCIIVVALLLVANFNTKFQVVSYLRNRANASTLFEDYYVHPNDVKITFPEEKRNLVYIILESISNGMSDATVNGDNKSYNIIPKLSVLNKEGVSFSNSEKMGGPQMYWGSTVTISALVSHTSGTPLLGPMNPNKLGSHGSFLPGITSIGEILEENGYTNYFSLGSNIAFAHRDLYFSTHGNYTIYDLNHWYDIGKVPKGYDVFWGIEDSKLFEYSKEKLIEISKKDEPFNFTLLTVDSHFTDGYKDKSCPSTYSISYANSIECADSLVSDFVRWIMDQEFYENTTVVLVSDHETMNINFLEEANIEDKSLYNVFLNTTKDYDTKLLINRQMSVVDMFPTTLSSLNVEVQGERLGLGTNLFSSKQTIPEMIGIDEYINQLKMKSNFYESNFFRFRKK